MYKFGPHTISAGQVFLKTKHSLGLVNLKPILPRRSCARFLDLSAEEVSDIFQSAQRIGKVVERQYGGSSLTIACQDGPDAGQSVPHCHVHVIPRRLGDFVNNDDIYDEIARNTKDHLTTDTTTITMATEVEKGLPKKGVDNEDRGARSEEDMAKEAALLASLLEGQQME
ncbi:hypothetical protein EDD11_002252 [Mortierella claussenii]|nr:hypothetical protein EDD11_002252 [Mortierella claussenii]